MRPRKLGASFITFITMDSLACSYIVLMKLTTTTYMYLGRYLCKCHDPSDTSTENVTRMREGYRMQKTETPPQLNIVLLLCVLYVSLLVAHPERNL